MGGLTLIIGGVRSGKSTYALSQAGNIPGQKAFVATAEPLDEEMRLRIAKHREERALAWDTFEEPLEIPPLLQRLVGTYDVVLVDCLTLWVSNLVMAGRNVGGERRELESVLCNHGESSLFLVSNEVGMGIVPEYPLGRVYRDALGLANSGIARISDRVVLMVAGIPLVIKGGV